MNKIEPQKLNTENQELSPKINVLVVDDSLTIRKSIAELLAKTRDITVVGEAKNGKEAIEQTEKLHPDVVLMDIVMPEMDGLAATKYLMAHQPIPIVIHSSAKNRGDIYKTWDIMKAGALASIEKTGANQDTPTWETNLFRTIRAASQVRVIRHRTYLPAQQSGSTVSARISKKYNVIALGISTGGPVTIAKILNAFPPDYKLPILTVMHTKDSTAFCSWLDSNCNLKVAFASDGDRLDEQEGRVLLPPNNTHLIVKKNRVKLCESPPVNFCKPSIDVLFNSLAMNTALKSIAVLLTGMGEDGAQGLKAIRDSGGYTICQDEETSVIYGMPKVAISLGAAKTVLPDHQIANKIVSLTNTQ